MVNSFQHIQFNP